MKKGKKQDLAAVGMEVGKAFAGGVAGEIVGDLVAKYAPDWVSENPKLAEAVPAAAAFLGLYFLPDPKFNALFLGMAGAAGAGLSDDIIQMSGFNQSYGSMNGTDADEIRKGIEYIEKLQNEAFSTMQGSFDNAVGQGFNSTGNWK